MPLKPARPARLAVSGVLLALTLLTAWLSLGGVSARAATLTRGFEDDVWFNSGWQTWVHRTTASGARVVSLEVDWAHVEPNRPAGAGSASPSATQYGFKYIDDVLKRFRGTGVRPLLLITDAPRWAQGRGGTATEYADGGFEPDTTALRQFAQALARRYSGHFRDPANRSGFLPKVTYFQAWAEANMGYKLSPQWKRERGRLVNTGPGLYRNLLNAFYAGIKAGDPSAKVLFTGLAPYGDPRGGMRTRPVTFLRSVLCLSAADVRQRCTDPPHFDVLASDPYEVGPPTQHAVNSDDASAPDLPRLTRVLSAAVRAGTVVPDVPKPLWVTEFGYDSNPPNTTRGTPSLAEQARWLEEALYVFSHEGASTVIWYLLHDQTGSFLSRYFSGVYFHDGAPKLSLTAYRFPLVVMPAGRAAQAWGIAPQTGTVLVQRQINGAWKTVFRFQRRAGQSYAGNMPGSAYGQYRAVEGKQTSLIWNYYRSRKRAGASAPPTIRMGSVSGSG